MRRSTAGILGALMVTTCWLVHNVLAIVVMFVVGVLLLTHAFRGRPREPRWPLAVELGGIALIAISAISAVAGVAYLI